MKIYVYSEDSGKDTFETLSNIYNKSIYLICPNAKTDLLFSQHHQLKEILNANNWRGCDEEDLNKICRQILTTIQSDNNDYIFWHLDSDIPWSEGECDRKKLSIFKQFQNTILKKISNLDGFNEETFFKRVIFIIPYSAIESWLFFFHDKIQEKSIAEEIKDAISKHSPKHCDEIVGLKHEVSFGNKHNLAISNYFSSKKLSEEKKSYFYFIEELSSLELFIQGLPKKY